jgi:hypothetical protein
MPLAELRYQQYWQQLHAITDAVQHGLAALRAHEEKLRKKVIGSPEVADALGRMRDGILMIGKSLEPKEILSDAQVKEIETQLKDWAESRIESAPASQLLLNLGLVMLCTQLEAFIGHLIDVTLATEPRLFLQLAPDKELRAKEILGLVDHEAVMQRLRDKVADEVDRAGTKEKFVKHLGERFGLIEESQITVSPRFEGIEPNLFKDWNLERFVSLFEERHRIVHRADFPVADISHLRGAQLLFGAVQTVLTVNAVRKYSIKLDSPVSAGLAYATAKWFCNIPDHCLKEFEEKLKIMFEPRPAG